MIESIREFDCVEFINIEEMMEKKERKKKKFILCIPVLRGEDKDILLNELQIASDLKKRKFLDQLILAFQGTEQDEIPKAITGKKKYKEVDIFYTSQIEVPDMAPPFFRKGKGSDMRRASYEIVKRLIKEREKLENVVLGFIDGDILPFTVIEGEQRKVFGSHYITGLFGPFLEDLEIKMNSLVYCRPKGYARINKLVARVLFSVIDHEKLNPIRPAYFTSGEKAWHLPTLLDIRFRQKYGIETQIWLELAFKLKPIFLATVNVGTFDHEHKGLGGLSYMSFGIVRTFLEYMIEQGIIKLGKGVKLSRKFEYSEIELEEEQFFCRKDLHEITYKPLKELFPQLK